MCLFKRVTLRQALESRLDLNCDTSPERRPAQRSIRVGWPCSSFGPSQWPARETVSSGVMADRSGRLRPLAVDSGRPTAATGPRLAQANWGECHLVLELVCRLGAAATWLLQWPAQIISSRGPSLAQAASKPAAHYKIHSGRPLPRPRRATVRA